RRPEGRRLSWQGHGLRIAKFAGHPIRIPKEISERAWDRGSCTVEYLDGGGEPRRPAGRRLSWQGHGLRLAQFAGHPIRIPKKKISERGLESRVLHCGEGRRTVSRARSAWCFSTRVIRPTPYPQGRPQALPKGVSRIGRSLRRIAIRALELGWL